METICNGCGRMMPDMMNQPITKLLESMPETGHQRERSPALLKLDGAVDEAIATRQEVLSEIHAATRRLTEGRTGEERRQARRERDAAVEMLREVDQLEQEARVKRNRLALDLDRKRRDDEYRDSCRERDERLQERARARRRATLRERAPLLAKLSEGARTLIGRG